MLDIDLKLNPKLPFSASIGRDLTEEDLAMQKLGGRMVEGAAQLKRLRNVHHRIARLLASGLRPIEVSVLTGYCQSRISVLQADGAFKELLNHYAEVEDQRFAEVKDILEDLTVDALAIMRERIEADPDKISLSFLKSLAEMTLDRTGRGPTTRNENVHAILTAEDLEEIKQHNVRDRVHSVQAQVKDNQRPALGRDTSGTSALPGKGETDILPIEGEVIREEVGKVSPENDDGERGV